MYTNGKARIVENSSRTQRRDPSGARDEIYIQRPAGNPNAGGNGRKNVYRAIEGSLRRLQTDYIDPLLDACMDMITPVEEVVASLDMLVKAGKVAISASRMFRRGMWRARRLWPSSKAARELPRYS